MGVNGYPLQIIIGKIKNNDIKGKNIIIRDVVTIVIIITHEKLEQESLATWYRFFSVGHRKMDAIKSNETISL